MQAMNPPETGAVAIVVHRAFGARLDELAARMHVWILDTPENRAAAERLRRAGGEVTTFTANSADGPEQQAVDILASVEEHHGVERQEPPCCRIDVFGAQPDALVRASFEAWGYTALTPTANGFVALKQVR